MTTLYLGAVASFLKMILNTALKPIFNVISKALGVVFSWLFNKILAPLLEVILLPLVDWLVKFLMKLLASVFYKIFAALLQLVEILERSFDILMGVRPVLYDGKTVSLIELLMTMKSTRTIFLSVTIFAIAMMFVFTIYAVVKSTFDFDFEGKKPVAQVLRMFFTSCTSFISVPIMAFIAIYLAGAIMTGLMLAFDENSTSMATYIFLVASMKAANPDAKYDGYTYNSSYKENPTMNDTLRALFTSGKVSYTDFDTCAGIAETFGGGSDTGLFAVDAIDYIVGILAGVVIFILLAMCLLTAVSRIFEIMILYIVSPLFVAYMPIDDNQFKTWRKTFWAKIFTVYGGYVAMRVYLLIVGLVMGSNIDFGLPSGYAQYNYYLQLAFLVGGAWSVYKSFNLVTYLLDFQSAENEMAVAQKGASAAKWAATKVAKAEVGLIKKAHAYRGRLKANAESQHQTASEMFNGSGKSSEGQGGGSAGGGSGGGSGGGHGGGGSGGSGGGSEAPRKLKGTSLYTGANKDKNGDTVHNFGLFKVTVDKNGNGTSFSIPFLFRMQSKQEVDKDGKLTGNTVRSVSFFGRTGRDGGGILSFNTKRDSNNKKIGGGMELSGIVKYDKSDKGEKSLSVLGKIGQGKGVFNIKKDAEGNLQKLRIMGFQGERIEKRGADGKVIGGKMKMTDFANGIVRTGYTSDANGNIKKAYQTTRILFFANTKFHADPIATATSDASGDKLNGIDLPPADKAAIGSATKNDQIPLPASDLAAAQGGGVGRNDQIQMPASDLAAAQGGGVGQNNQIPLPPIDQQSLINNIQPPKTEGANKQDAPVMDPQQAIDQVQNRIDSIQQPFAGGNAGNAPTGGTQPQGQQPSGSAEMAQNVQKAISKPQEKIDQINSRIREMSAGQPQQPQQPQPAQNNSGNAEGGTGSNGGSGANSAQQQFSAQPQQQQPAQNNSSSAAGGTGSNGGGGMNNAPQPQQAQQDAAPQAPQQPQQAQYNGGNQGGNGMNNVPQPQMQVQQPQQPQGGMSSEPQQPQQFGAQPSQAAQQPAQPQAQRQGGFGESQQQRPQPQMNTQQSGLGRAPQQAQTQPSQSVRQPAQPQQQMRMQPAAPQAQQRPQMNNAPQQVQQPQPGNGNIQNAGTANNGQNGGGQGGNPQGGGGKRGKR